MIFLYTLDRFLPLPSAAADGSRLAARRYSEKRPEHSALKGMSPSNLPSEFREPLPPKRKKEECTDQRGWRTPSKQGLLNQLSKGRMNSQILELPGQGLHMSAPGPLHLQHSSASRVLKGFLGLWLLCPLLLSFPLLVCLVQLWCESFCFLYLKN